MSAISNEFAPRVNTPSDGFSALSSGDFLKIIFTELTNQDPLQPNETKDLLQQLSTIRAIESDISLADRLESVAKQNEITSAGVFVGKFIVGRTDNGLQVAGFVDSVSVTREGTVLNLGSGYRVPFKNLEEIVDPEIIESAPAGDDGEGDGEEPQG